VINLHAQGAWVGVLGKPTGVQVNTTRIAKISANPKNGSKNKYFAKILNLQRGAVIYQCKTLQEDVKE
jgi:hypothetical protein